METKICKKCGELKTLDLFPKSKNCKDGYENRCRDCRRKYDLNYRQNNKEKNLIQSRERYQRTKDKKRANDRKWKNETMKKTDSKWNYDQLHYYMKKCHDKPELCAICNKKKKLDFANISGEYKEDPKDYFWICRSCHMTYDRLQKEKWQKEAQEEK